MSFLDVLGNTGTVLGIVSFFENLLPPPPSGDARGAVVRVKAGLAQGDDVIDIRGDINAVYGWDTNNNYLGQSTNGFLEEGDFIDFTLDQTSQGTRAEFIGVSATDDAVCIAWITVTPSDGSDRGAWTGDIGAACDQTWYPSAEFAGRIDSEAPSSPENDYFPRCTWIDRDFTFDVDIASFKFRTRAYSDTLEIQRTLDEGNACRSTIFGTDSGPISAVPAKRSNNALVPLYKRDRKQWIKDTLVVSNIIQHSAEQLCSSQTSYGPDFVDVHGNFCDMETKTQTPLCSYKDVDGCMELDGDENKITKRTNVAKRAVKVTHRSYKKVKSWVK